MRITAITSQIKNKDRVSVFVDEKYTFSLSVSQLSGFGLRVGDELDEKKINSYKDESNLGKLQELALNWALRRNHSEKEINAYIARKTDNPAAQKRVIEYLDKLGFVDDKAFADAWVISRRRRGYSKYVIKGELIKKGVAAEIIEVVTDSEEEEREALAVLIEKKKSKYQDNRKLMAYLSSKGYTYDVIKEMLEQS